MTKSTWKIKIEEIAKRDREKKMGKESEMVKQIRRNSGDIIYIKKIIEGLNKKVFNQSQEEKDIRKCISDNDEWLDLDINNIPSDFYTNEFLEIENRWKNGEWLQSDNIDIKDRWEIIKNLLTDECFEYRYRSKPLESMKISQKVIDKYNLPVSNQGIGKPSYYLDGHKVEIIK